MKMYTRKTAFLIYLVLSLCENSWAQLVDADATLETKELKAFLDSIYGKKIISGQMDDGYLDYIQQNTGGKSPAMMGYDFNGVCPSQEGNHDAEKAIEWVLKQNGIAQFQWHWISPNADGDFYTKNFNLAAALNNPSGSSYKNIIRDIDLVAREIRKMHDVGVPILWRPLHEAEGKWFWWGMSGGDACKKLYRLIYDRFVAYHDLHNLIWVWTSYGASKENWYPGDDVVDLIVYDYPDYSATGSWSQYQNLFGAKGKLFGIGEDGKLFDPILFTSQPWLYFMTWSYMIQEPSQKDGKNTKAWLYSVYNDPRVLTLADLQKGPRAHAGASRTVLDSDGDGQASVVLDGSASTTDKGSIVSYTWTENDSILANTAKATVTLKSGRHAIILTIVTSENQSKSASLVITVKTTSLAFGKKVTVSTTEPNNGNIAAHAVDANQSTRWSSVYSDPQWIQVDLGKPTTIKKVVLKWETASAKNYRLEVSDDAQVWTVLQSKTDMPPGARSDTLNNLTAKNRYLRVYGTARTTTYGYSLYEIEIYDDKWGLGAAAFPVKNNLLQNYPNPFNPFTTIEFYLTEDSHVLLEVFNAKGQKVAALIDQQKPAGLQRTFFNAQELACGVYFCRLTVAQAGQKGVASVKKMILLR